MIAIRRAKSMPDKGILAGRVCATAPVARLSYSVKPER
jgi:hypothetical protein